MQGAQEEGEIVRIGDALRKEFSFIQGNYLILVLSWVLMDLAAEMPTPNYQFYVQALGGTGLALGIIGFTSFMALAAVQFPGGFLADRYGRKWLVSTMTFGLAISFLFYALAPSWHFILLGVVIQNLCLIYQPALFAMVSDSLPPERRGMGFSIIMLINSVVTTPGPIFAGLLFLHFGLENSMRIVYLIMTALYLSAAVMRLRLKETMTNGDPIEFKEFVSSYPRAIRESFDVWKTMPKSMFWLFITQVLAFLGLAFIQVINALYARDVLLIPESQWWLVFIPLFISMILLSFPIGKIVDKVGRKTPLLLSSLALAPAALLFIYGDFARVLIAMPLLGLGQLLAMSAASALQTDLVPQEKRGKVIGFTNFVSYIFMGFGMLLGNYLYASVLPQLPFLLLLVLLIPQFLITVFLIAEPKKREK